MIFFTIFCTKGTTEIAVGKAITKAKMKDFIQMKKKFSTKPRLTNNKTPDMMNAMMAAIKNGKRILGFFKNFGIFV